MYPRSVRDLQADALFVSALQRSDELNASQIQRVGMVALHACDGKGCAGRVAQVLARVKGSARWTMS